MKKIKLVSLILPAIIASSLYAGRTRINSSNEKNKASLLSIAESVEPKKQTGHQLSFNSGNNMTSSPSNFDLNSVPISKGSSNEINTVLSNDWICYNMKGIGEITLPPTLELRNENSVIAHIASIVKQNVAKTYNLESMESKYIFQPTGTNKRDKQALEYYSRILVDKDSGSNGSFATNKELSTLSTDEINEVNRNYREMILNFAATGENKVIDWEPIEIEKYNDAYLIKIQYKRQATGKTPVQVQMYICPNYSEEIRVTISYRESEAHRWAADFEKVMSSFKIHKNYKI